MSMWDEKYSDASYFYGTEPNDFLKENVTHLPMGKVLCLADGEGRNSVFLAKQGYSVTAVDASPVGLDKATRLAQENNVEITTICADLNEFDLGHMEWDGIVSIFCHLPAPLRAKVHGAVQSALTVNGVFLLEAYTPKQLEFGTGGPRSEAFLMSQDQLTTDLDGLDFVQLHETTRTITEGQGHNGQSAVVQCIAKKRA